MADPGWAPTPPPTRRASRPRWPRLGLAPLLAGFCALSVCAALRVPVGEPPDEAQHLAYVEQLAGGQWPADIRRLPPGSEAHQPPLYYTLAAVVWLVSGHRVLAVRLLSTLCGLLTIGLTYRLGRELFPEASPLLPLAAAGMVAFLPMNLYLCSVVNNDALACALVTQGLLLLALGLRTGLTSRHAVGLGLFCGFALLAKSTGLCLTVAVVTACLVVRAPWRQKVLWTLLVLAGMLLIAGPWLVHNTVLYGDPLAGHAIAAMSPSYSPDWLARPVAHRLRRAFEPLFLWRSFWGGFGTLSADRCFYPWWVYWVCTGWLVLALEGWCLRGRELLAETGRRVFAWGLLAGLAMLGAGYVALNLLVFQAQGRYFFALLPPLALALCAGLARLWPGRRGPWIPVAFVAGLLALSVWGLRGPML